MSAKDNPFYCKFCHHYTYDDHICKNCTFCGTIDQSEDDLIEKDDSKYEPNSRSEDSVSYY